jgi:aspartyl-tRNA(Asn)/glutamyl-tRNA(Gln) amidotransferase subunit B
MLADLIGLLESGAISGKTAKDVFQQMFKTGRDPRQLVEEQGLGQIEAGDEVVAAADAAIAANAKAAQDYRSGKEEAIKFLVGQVMKETRGRARPEDVTSILKEKLNKRP